MKNIIFLVTDTYRYDNLSDTRDMPVRTPNLNRFAAERAASFSGCYTASFPTIPHRTDAATGRLGWPHYGWQGIEKSGNNHIAKLLGNCGYSTQLLCDCPHLFNSGFNHGFDAAYQSRGQEGDRALLHLNDAIEQVLPQEKTRTFPLWRGATLADVHQWTNRYMKLESDSFSSRTSALTVRWLEENYQAGPFFLWVDFFDPHEPWDPPEYMVKRYDPDYTGTPMTHPNYGRSDAYTPAELRNLRAHYAAEAELVDRGIGRVLQKIDDLALWDDSIVVVTTDHGMSLGEHGRTGKSNISDDDPRYWPLYPEVSHVPFLVAGSGISGGGNVNSFFQAPDILPTLADLAGASLQPPEPFTGKSAAGIIRGEEAVLQDYAVSGCHISGSADGGIPAGATTPFLVKDSWGFAPVGANGGAELYDLSGDALAAEEISVGNESVVRELHQLFLHHLRTHGVSDDMVAPWVKPRIGSGSWAIDY